MDKQVQIRKGTTAQNNAFTGALGELSFDTQQNRLRTHDGALAGGYPHALKSEVDAKEPLLGFTPEDVANKAIDFSVLNNTLYPTTQAVSNFVGTAVAAVTPPFIDTQTLVKGSGDPTKLLRFEVDGFTAATTRVLTPQNADYTIAGLETANVFTAHQSVNGNTIIQTDGLVMFANSAPLTYSLGISTEAQLIGNKNQSGAENAVQVGLGGSWNTTGSPTALQISVSRLAAGANASLAHLSYNFLFNTTATGLWLDGPDPALAGLQQYSPSIRLTGQGWKTNATAGSQPVDWRIYNQPVQGSAAPSTNLLFDASINGGAFTNVFSLTSAGNAGVQGALSVLGGSVTVASTFGFAVSTRSQLRSSADGLFELFNAAATGFTRLNFGGTTSSFPGLQRVTTGLSLLLADGTNGSLFTIPSAAIGVTPTDVLVLTNTNAAAAGAQQYSPSLKFTGQGWKTDATAASQSVDFRMQVATVQGAASPAGVLQFDSSINGGAYSLRMSISTGGTFTCAGPFVMSSGNMTVADATAFIFGARGRISASADGIFGLFDNATTSFGRLNFGGTTSSFPAWARNSAGLSLVLADGTNGSLLTLPSAAIGATPTHILLLTNTTAAAAGAQQYSPAIRFTGQGWKTNATAASQPVDWRIYNVPTQGSANPSSILIFDFSVNGGAFGTVYQFFPNGQLNVAGGGGIASISSGAALVMATGGGSSGDMTLSTLNGTSRAIIFSPSSTEQMRLTQGGLVTFAGITSSFPAIKRVSATIEFRLADDSADAAIKASQITTSAVTFMHRTSAALNNGAGGGAGTLTNAPAAGDPTKWIPIDDNGTTRYIPAW